MAAKIEMQVRAQYLCNGKWKTIDTGDNLSIVIESQMVDLLTRWVAWFEGRGFTDEIRLFMGPGYEPDHVYTLSKALLNDCNQTTHPTGD